MVEAIFQWHQHNAGKYSDKFKRRLGLTRVKKVKIYQGRYGSGAKEWAMKWF
jgi:hypothetical protein